MEHNKNQLGEQDSPKSALLNLLFNIVIPVLILSKWTDEAHLGPVKGLIVALAFPVIYGAWDLFSKKKWNFVSVLGVVSVLLTGGLALFKLDGFWFAVKEAAIPGIIGIVVLFTAKSKYNLVRMLILSPKLIKVEVLDAIIKEQKLEVPFEKLVIKTTYFFVLSFVASAILNFVLAIVILKSPAGTPEFNAELGKMTALSFPVIMIPSMAILIFSLWFLLRGITKMTGVHYNEVIRS
ncbi:MAG: MFS transporter [Epsilonproteobacteria bacterium]|nr:MAG: MFS transporter [Campylobacterota bacterium]RLA66073.1 MAG: MFS transporter [Campylobacterota bacterium]